MEEETDGSDDDSTTSISADSDLEGKPARVIDVPGEPKDSGAEDGAVARNAIARWMTAFVPGKPGISICGECAR